VTECGRWGGAVTPDEYWFQHRLAVFAWLRRVFVGFVPERRAAAIRPRVSIIPILLSGFVERGTGIVNPQWQQVEQRFVVNLVLAIGVNCAVEHQSPIGGGNRSPFGRIRNG